MLFAELLRVATLQIPSVMCPMLRPLLMVVSLRTTHAVDQTAPEPGDAALFLGLASASHFGSLPSGLRLFIGLSKMSNGCTDADQAAPHTALHWFHETLIETTGRADHTFACSSAHKADAANDTTDDVATADADWLDDSVLAEVHQVMGSAISLAAAAETTRFDRLFQMRRHAATRAART